MADSDTIGSTEDEVQLRIGEKLVAIAKSYDVTSSMFSQPSAWSLTTGSGDTAADIVAKFQPGEQFQIFIGGNLQQSGLLEDVEVEQAPDGGSDITFRGRDWMMPLHESSVVAEKSFTDSTYLDLVTFALKEVRLEKRLVVKTNAANRKLRTGIPISEISPPHLTVEQLLEAEIPGGSVGGVTAGVFKNNIKANLGESLHAFLRRYLDRAGLLFFAAADGSFVLTTANIHQPPAMQIVRKALGDTRAQVNVERASLRNFTSHRHSEVRIYGKGGGRRAGRAKQKSAFVDEEIEGYGLYKPMVVRDANIETNAQALFLARRRICDERKAGYVLTYVVTGHTALSMLGGQRATWVPDTIVHVDDDLVGIHDSFYLESCDYHRGSDGTRTTLHLVRTNDMTFGEFDAA